MQVATDSIKVTFSDGTEQTCPKHTLVKDLMKTYTREDGLEFVCAVANNDVVSLSYPLDVDTTLDFQTLSDRFGWRVYRRSVSFLLAKAVRELFPKATFSVEHSLGTGFYCDCQVEGTPITPSQVAQIESLMREWIAKDLPIEREKISFNNALAQFEKEGQMDKFNLLRFQNPPKIVIYTCEGFSDLAHAVLANSTGVLGRFKLLHHDPGLLVQFSDRDNPTEVMPYVHQPHLFQIFKEHKEWGRILGVNTVGSLNQTIATGKFNEFVKIAEALHEKKVAQIAESVKQRGDTVKWLLIAGPSSAGKTTFSKRLGVQLRVAGLTPSAISVDDYFVNRDKTPRDENGNYDFEHVEAIDLELLNDHLTRLSNGEEVELPKFDFEQGKRVYKGHKVRLREGEIVILEGIHCLNPLLSAKVPDDQKFRIYVSALTQLKLDYNNRISTTDNRLLRRMVRDYKYRGHSALTTLKMWPSVRRGEKKWIFPTQQHANVAFNSALDYELAVLKRIAEPLLAQIKPNHEEYGDARRLQDFLGNFIVAPEEEVPATSILREYIGKSSFEY